MLLLAFLPRHRPQLVIALCLVFPFLSISLGCGIVLVLDLGVETWTCHPLDQGRYPGSYGSISSSHLPHRFTSHAPTGAH